MPDLLTHSVAGYVLIFRDRKKVFEPSVLLLGCIYPDFLRAPLLITGNLISTLFGKVIPPEIFYALHVFHSPIPLIVQAWLFSLFFAEAIRKRVMISFCVGIFTHLLLDAGQRAYSVSYFWLFPFSFENPIAGLWWSDEGLGISITAGFIGIVLWALSKRKSDSV